MLVDCETCPVRGQRCEDCMVPVLLSMSPHELPLDAPERAALDLLVGAGLVARADALAATARHETPLGFARVG